MSTYSNGTLAGEIVDRWKPVLGLSDWRIGVKYGGTGKECPAEIDICPGARAAEITLYENWQQLSTEWDYGLEEIMLHELLHAAFSERAELEPDLPITEWLCNRIPVFLQRSIVLGGAEVRTQLANRKEIIENGG